jgi:hypothetical protein
MSEKVDSDLERIKEIWPRLPWFFKMKILFLASYYVFCYQIDMALEKVNLAWFWLIISIKK